MGSGESDVKYVRVTPYNEAAAAQPSYQHYDLDLINTTGTAPTTTTSHYCGSWCNHRTNNTWDTFTWYSPYTVYLYQIFCPKRSCKTANWLQLDVIKPCSKCGSKLKAVSNKADYEIPVAG